MPRLFLHVGFPKTATTTIQSFLAANRGRLQQAGWLYPLAARQNQAHHPLGNFFRTAPLDWIKTADPDVVRAKLLAEMRESECDKVIMSTESLASAPNIGGIKEYFRGFEISIVFFVRRQDEWLESAYQEELKNGLDSEDITTYFETRTHWLDYGDRLDRWARVFGRENIILGRFEKSSGRQSVEKIFMEMIGAPWSDDYKIPLSENSRLNRDCLAFFLQMKDKRRVGPKFTFFAEILRAYSEAHPDPAGLRNFFPPATRCEIVSAFAESNARVAREYLGIEDGTLFSVPPPDPEAPWQEYPGLQVDKVVEIADFMANELFEKYIAEKHRLARFKTKRRLAKNLDFKSDEIAKGLQQ